MIDKETPLAEIVRQMSLSRSTDISTQSKETIGLRGVSSLWTFSSPYSRGLRSRYYRGPGTAPDLERERSRASASPGLV